ncbi:MAG TPA: putative metal-dependent hydrolase [Thermoanaerobaculia bacterium]|nr:putative metal-dependent hydrolase [Thermoanaerobaculia bacterium]
MEDLRYPIGKFVFDEKSDRAALLESIEETPVRLRQAVAGLSEEQLETAYRPEGWTVRQVVHHLPDSHLNAYTRFKLALTEDEPGIRGYDEDKWSHLHDATTGPIDVSLNLLEALHQRWMLILRSLSATDFERGYRHSEMGLVPLKKALALYAWHGQHHVAHVTALRKRMNW